MNSLQQQIRIFFTDPQKLKLMVMVVVIIGVGGVIVSGYFIYLNRVEESLSLEVNQRVKAKNEIIDQWSKGEVSGEDYTNQLIEISGELHQIYLNNPNTQNGIRALITSAQLDILLDYGTAEEKLQLVIADGRELKPIALYMLSHFYENQENYTKALDALKDFKGEYVIHYLKPLTMFTEARIHRVLNQQDQAAAIYTEILQNEEYSLFFDKAEEGISLIEWERRNRGLAGSGELFNPNFGTGLEPEYLNTNY